MASLARAAVVVLIVVGLIGGLAAALVEHTGVVGGVPVVWVVAAVALGVNWLAFVPAALWKTERFYDATGTATFLAISGVAIAAAPSFSLVRLVPAAFVVVWALRLGSFLVARIHTAGKDGRFDEMKQKPARFLVAWTLQGLWTFLTALAAVVLVTSTSRTETPTVAEIVGWALWAVGFGLEAIADRQKKVFASDANNRGRFISTGLWAWSRHPNYFGEILLWTGVFVSGAQVYVGAQWLTVLSPIFVALLLIKISGVPLLEKRADEKWATDADYQAYKAKTPVLVLRPPRR